VTESDQGDEPRSRRPDDDPTDFEVAQYLWAEYQYRHDMVWKLSFRITAVAAALLIAPFLAEESVHKAVGDGLLALPALAIVVILGGLFTLQSELGLLDLIRKAYRAAQFDVLNLYVSANELKRVFYKPEKRGSLQFAQRVRVYLWVLLVGAIIYSYLLYEFWLDDLVDPPRAFTDAHRISEGTTTVD
jgi:hypothetical protein